MKDNIFFRAGQSGVDLVEIVEEFDLYSGFNKRSIEEAERAQIDEGDYAGRTDFRQQVVFTIDGEDSRDFDDAVGIEKTKDGYVLFVHIADVSHYVKMGSQLDKDAFRRGTSVYFPFGCLPMLPHKLSDDICSLVQGSDRLTLSVVIELDKKGNLLESKIVESVIRSSARLSYGFVQEVLEGRKEACEQIVGSLRVMEELAKALIKKRDKKGVIDLDSLECEFVFKGNEVVDLRKRQRLFSHRLIEEFMILANEAVARKISKKTPFLYRVHESPSPLKAERLADFLLSRGIDLVFDTSPTVFELKQIYDQADEGLKSVLGMMILRTMSKAAYSPFRKHHFGLNLDYYCHFTSPIRRYPDLFIHRVIKAIIHGESLKPLNKNLEQLAEHCSKTERVSDEAERKVDDVVKAHYMKRHIGERFEGVISGVCDFGIFVQLENTAEGLVRIDNLPGYQIFDKESLCLITRNSKTTYSLGDRLEIEVAGVRYGKIEFTL